MAITYIDSATVDFGQATNLTFDLTGVTFQANDVGLVFVKQSQNTTAGVWDDDGGGGNGWTQLIYRRSTSGRDMESAVYYKVLGAAESNPTFTWNDSVGSQPMSGSVLIYRGVDIDTPVMNVSYRFSSNDPTPAANSVTVAGADNAIVALHGLTHDDITTPGPPTGYTMRSQVWNGTVDDHRNIFVADFLTNVPIGSYTAPDWTHTTSATTPESHYYVVALNELQPVSITGGGETFNWSDSVTFTGFGFGALQGTSTVEASDTSDFSGTVVTQSISTDPADWSDTSLTILTVQSTLPTDDFIYFRVTNNDGDVSKSWRVAEGLLSYTSIVDSIGSGPEHKWTFNNNYDDTGSYGLSPFTNSSTNGGGSFITTPICEGNTHAWRCQLSQRTCNNSPFMNDDVTTHRVMGGWIRLQTVQESFACIFEEGGGTNNLAFFSGMGNTIIAQLADTNDDNVQAFSDITLSAGRDYHILIYFSYSSGVKEFALYLDGLKQAVSSGNPLTSTDLDSHGGDITLGGAGGNLEVGGTDVGFSSTEDCLFSQWASWFQNIPQSDLSQLFKRGAIPTVIISSDTEANMQAALDAIADTVRPDSPLAIRIENVSGGGDLNLKADNIQFDDRCSITIEWRGTGTLNWSNLNSSNLQNDSRLFAARGGLINVIDVPVLTLTGIQSPSEVRIYEAGTINEVAGQENVTTGAFSASIESSTVDVVIIIAALEFQNIRLKSVDMSTDLTLPIQQRRDRFYNNPT